jgi:hypothetical protein
LNQNRRHRLANSFSLRRQARTDNSHRRSILYPAWKPGSLVCHRDDPCYGGRLVRVQRVQRSGLCYIHTPDVLQHYLVEPKSGYGGYLENDLTSSKTTVDHLRRCWITYSWRTQWSTSSDCMRSPKTLSPSLVGQFRIHEDFHGDNVKCVHWKSNRWLERQGGVDHCCVATSYKATTFAGRLYGVCSAT